MSMLPNNTLIVVADGRAARFFRNAGSESGLRLRQDDVMSIDAADESGPSGVQPQDNDVDEAAFAKVLSDRINQAALQHRFDHIVLVADPSTLGEMRPQLHKEVQARMKAEVAKDWTNMPQNDIEKALDQLRI